MQQRYNKKNVFCKYLNVINLFLTFISFFSMNYTHTPITSFTREQLDT